MSIRIFSVFIFGAVAAAFTLPLGSAIAAPLGYKVVEFELNRFSADDSYPEYFQLDAKGVKTSSKASLRCVESAYDGNVAWRYQELMVFDEAGKVVKRKELRPNVSSERGYRYTFQSFKECEKAVPTDLDDGVLCTMKLELSEAKSAARFVSASCRKR